MYNNIILNIENFTTWHEPNLHKPLTMRDLFVSAISNPFSFFSQSKDRLVIFNSINLTVERGDVLGLLGVNGIGKTTLCRYLAGIIKSSCIKTTGEVRAIFETNISFYSNLTGRENAIILTEIMYSSSSKAEKKAILDEALYFSELNEFLDVALNNYSRGMKARLYLSIVTAKETDLLILDEVFGGTDVFFATKIEARIKNLIAKSGAVVLVSHNIEDIKNYCNRVVILSDKNISFDGPPDEGIAKYTHSLTGKKE